MKILELQPARRVLWEVVERPKEWIGTTVSWDLKQDGDYAIVLFKHQGWKEPVEFMHHCSTKWAVFLLSLKSLVETGKAPPTRTTSRSTTGTEWTRVVSVRRRQGVNMRIGIIVLEAWGGHLRTTWQSSAIVSRLRTLEDLQA